MGNLITIACVGPNLEIGCNNDLIWKFKEDLQTFKAITMGHPMVMGFNTWKSLPGMLPGRKHLVISDRPHEFPEGVEMFSSIEEFVDYANRYDGNIFVIGGGMIYRQLLPYSNKMILTEVDAQFTSGEQCIYFPKFDKADWMVDSNEDFVDASGVRYSRKIYLRK